MPDYFLKALFVTAGAMLISQLHALTPHAKGWFSRVVLHGAAGLAALLSANMAGSFLGLGIGLNGLTLPVSALFGVPGVGLLWAIKYFL